VELEKRLRATFVRHEILQNGKVGINRIDLRERARTSGIRLHELEPEGPGPDTLRRPLALKHCAYLDRTAVSETDCPTTEVPPELRVARSALVDDVVLAERAHDLRARHPQLDLADAHTGIDRLFHSGCARRDDPRHDENRERPQWAKHQKQIMAICSTDRRRFVKSLFGRGTFPRCNALSYCGARWRPGLRQPF
jgi:hypothetical protein